MMTTSFTKEWSDDDSSHSSEEFMYVKGVVESSEAKSDDGEFYCFRSLMTVSNPFHNQKVRRKKKSRRGIEQTRIPRTRKLRKILK